MNFKPVFLAVLALSATTAFAQKAGSLSASAGFTQIAPDVSSGNLSAPSLPGTQVDINSNTQITGAVNYAMSDNIVINVPLGLGFKHKISGAGAIAGAGVIGTTKALPITLLGQYRFGEANATFRPFVGAGLSYIVFYKEKGTSVLTALTNPGGPATTLSFKDKLAPTIQIGVVYNVNERWYLEGNYAKTFLKTVGTLSTGQTISAKLDPNAYTIQVGYKF